MLNNKEDKVCHLQLLSLLSSSNSCTLFYLSLRYTRWIFFVPADSTFKCVHLPCIYLWGNQLLKIVILMKPLKVEVSITWEEQTGWAKASKTVGMVKHWLVVLLGESQWAVWGCSLVLGGTVGHTIPWALVLTLIFQQRAGERSHWSA